MSEDSSEPPDKDDKKKWARGALSAIGGAIPFAGGLISAAASVWGETEQERVIAALKGWIKMLEDEMKEKQRTIVDIVRRIDLHDDEISKRVKSSEYQSILKKAFRNWAGTESLKKQEYIRNILTNAASTRIVDDEVVKLFVDWLQMFSEFHFAVIGELYRNPGSTRAEIWENLGKGSVREDSAEADLFKLLVRDLTMGGIIRQHREVDSQGNFRLKQRSSQRNTNSSRVAKSAFDDDDRYELTSLGNQFVHYAMTEVTIKLEYQPDANSDDDSDEG